jgi:2-methylisocitrate lyase-like PEP mutase family enzyme
MDKSTQKRLAMNFAHLHQQPRMFVLPNVWNGGSARVFEKQGFKAIATTSAGVSYSMGYEDGEVIGLDELCYVIKQISRRVSIPLSVDLERGYGNTTEEVLTSVKRVIEAGAVGINIEDGHPGAIPHLENVPHQVEVIKAIAELKAELDIPFVLNARTCAMWLNVCAAEDRLKIAIERGNAFAVAGADCVFIPGAIPEDEVKTLVDNISVPLNLIANPTFKDFDRLNEIGVRRLSIGSGAVRAVFARLIDIARELDGSKSIEPMLNHDFSYDRANAYFGK